MNSATDSLWNTHATRWHSVGCPLRPSAPDLKVFQEALSRFARERGHVRALLLGVTPELTALDWPSNCELVAVDSSQVMWRRHWAAPRGIASSVVLGRWERMPLQRDSMDLVLADGSLSILANAVALNQVLARLADVVRKGGHMILRTFVRPEIQEPPARVIAAMRRGEMRGFDALKWRFLMSLHDSATEGVQLQSVYRAFREAVPDSSELARQLGWRVESIDTIESYRNAAGRYFFPTLAQLRQWLHEHFVEVECSVPEYELGQCCPILVLGRR